MSDPDGVPCRCRGSCSLAIALLLAATPARAEWFYREEAIMGTRVAVELWSEDAELANARHGGGDRRDAPHRRADEHVQAGEPALRRQRARVRAAGDGRSRDHRRRGSRARVFAAQRRRVRRHLCQRRLSLRLPRPPTPERRAGRSGAARHVDYRQVQVDREREHDPLPAQGRAHRPRRHRQGLCGGPQHRHAARARHRARDGQCGRRHAPARRSPRQAVDRRRPRSRATRARW